MSETGEVRERKSNGANYRLKLKQLKTMNDESETSIEIGAQLITRHRNMKDSKRQKLIKTRLNVAPKSEREGN